MESGHLFYLRMTYSYKEGVIYKSDFVSKTGVGKADVVQRTTSLFTGRATLLLSCNASKLAEAAQPNHDGNLKFAN